MIQPATILKFGTTQHAAVDAHKDLLKVANTQKCGMILLVSVSVEEVLDNARTLKSGTVQFVYVFVLLFINADGQRYGAIVHVNVFVILNVLKMDALVIRSGMMMHFVDANVLGFENVLNLNTGLTLLVHAYAQQLHLLPVPTPNCGM